MSKHYFTFGQNHAHSVSGRTFDKDSVVEIEAADPDAARKIMFDTFGQKWSFQYPEPPDMKYFPRGIIPLVAKTYITTQEGRRVLEEGSVADFEEAAESGQMLSLCGLAKAQQRENWKP
jgi:hypothetical protein